MKRLDAWIGVALLAAAGSAQAGTALSDIHPEEASPDNDAGSPSSRCRS